MIFMTDVLKLPVGLAAVIYTGVQWLEAVTMIGSGIYIDRVTTENGRFRPRMVSGALILTVGTVIFYTVFDIPLWAKTVVFVTGYLAAYWGFNLMWTAYRSLLGVLSRNPQDTISLNSASAQMGSLAGLVYSFISVRLLNGFSGQGTGYTVSAFVYGSVILLCMVIVSQITKPYDNGQTCGVEDGRKREWDLKDMLKVFTRPMCIYFVVITLREAASTVLPSLLVYYFTYVMGDANLMSVYLSVITFSGLIAHFFARKLANRYGKKQMFIVGSLLACVCIFCMRFTVNMPAAFMVLAAVKSCVEIFSGAFMPSFMMEIADYNEYTVGVHARGFTSSIGGTALRCAQIAGGAVASFGLVAIGYKSGMEVTAEVAAGISNLMIYGCILLILVSVVAMLFYQVDPDVMVQVYKQRTGMLDE